MLYNQDPKKTRSWLKLQNHFEKIKNIHMKDMFFEEDKKTKTRFDNFHLQFEDLLFDYSKNRINKETIELFIELAEEMKLKDAINKQFSGDLINETENRAVLHTALRDQSDNPIFVNGQDIKPEIKKVFDIIELFVNQVRSEEWKGFTGKSITDIVNIGIGGSDLGPVMAVESLKYYNTKLKTHFVSNVDGTHIIETLKDLDLETTLFIIASKTFTTQETMANANTAKKIFLELAKENRFVENHFIAVSTNKEKVVEFGINPRNMFEFWDWVGGRYSLWSSVGISIALAIGFDKFQEMHKGAYAMDEHFKNTEFSKNIPFIKAILGIWYNNFFNTATEAILPYDQYMHRFTAYLQQGDMESNGKYISRDGQQVGYQTGSIIWGEPGTNGQHAFYQLIHQGTKLIPCDFIAPLESLNPVDNHHKLLLSNYFAQTEALMYGRTKEMVMEELQSKGYSEDQIKKLTPYKIFLGNRPTNSFLIKKMTPYMLGLLIAMYEHKIFIQGIIWNIFSFDQWGVELGKELSNRILKELDNNEKINSHDSSTNNLINRFKEYH